MENGHSALNIIVLCFEENIILRKKNEWLDKHLLHIYYSQNKIEMKIMMISDKKNCMMSWSHMYTLQHVF